MDALSTTTKTQWDEHCAAKHIFLQYLLFQVTEFMSLQVPFPFMRS